MQQEQHQQQRGGGGAAPSSQHAAHLPSGPEAGALIIGIGNNNWNNGCVMNAIQMSSYLLRMFRFNPDMTAIMCDDNHRSSIPPTRTNVITCLKGLRDRACNSPFPMTIWVYGCFASTLGPDDILGVADPGGKPISRKEFWGWIHSLPPRTRVICIIDGPGCRGLMDPEAAAEAAALAQQQQHGGGGAPVSAGSGGGAPDGEGSSGGGGSSGSKTATYRFRERRTQCLSKGTVERHVTPDVIFIYGDDSPEAAAAARSSASKRRRRNNNVGSDDEDADDEGFNDEDGDETFGAGGGDSVSGGKRKRGAGGDGGADLASTSATSAAPTPPGSLGIDDCSRLTTLLLRTLKLHSNRLNVPTLLRKMAALARKSNSAFTPTMDTTWPLDPVKPFSATEEDRPYLLAASGNQYGGGNGHV